MENMYQQAIADAKALRASAMANAKIALQEAFEPKIQEMVRLSLAEELDETEEELEENFGQEDESYGADGGTTNESEEELDEAELDEILSELESLSEESEEELDEADMSYEFDEADLDEADEEEEGGDDEIEVDDTTADAEGDEETQEITVSLGDLKSVIDALKGLSPELEADEETGEEALVGDEESEEESEEGEEEKEEDELEETISLDEILAQLEEEEGLEEKKDKEKIAGHKGAAEKEAEKHTAYKKKVKAGPLEETEEELDEAQEDHETIFKHAGAATAISKKDTAYKNKLSEAHKAIAELQQSLNEVNLLNAKLLYMNKIFKAKTLNESQKIQVVKSFDKATSVKEVKNIYEVLKESVTKQTKKTQISESFGYASKPAGVSPKANVIDADPFVNRWQKLAGI